jgi:hypothetical protein
MAQKRSEQPSSPETSPEQPKPKRQRKAKAAETESESAAPADLSSMGLQTYRMVKMHRSQLKGAPYNPRILSEPAKRKLRAGLKKHGMVAPPTWNERTGNVVGGHQRLDALDALAGTANYDLDVAVIDVDELREKELNLLLNNQEAAGDFDLEGLQGILRTDGIDLEGTGFDHSDVFKLFGDSVMMMHDDGQLEAFAARVREMRDAYDGVTSGQGNRNSEDFYMVVVFRNEAARDRFAAKHGLDSNRYQSGEEFDRLMTSSATDSAKSKQA